MFERYSDRARRVLVLAQDEARLLNHRFIGTESILLGLLREGEGVAARALGGVGVSLEAARRKVEQVIGLGGPPPSGSPSFTPRAKKVLQFALREASEREHRDVDTEHLLLGLLDEGEGVASQVMVGLGADLDVVRDQVLELMPSRSATEVTRRGRSAPGTRPTPKKAGMDRVDHRARRALMLALEEARLLNHSFVGTEHLLLGLIHEGEGPAAQVLKAVGISLETARENVIKTIGPVNGTPSESPPFTPRSKKVLELALRESLALGHHYLGTEHLLLGLVREGGGVACQILVSMGASLDGVRDQVIQRMSGYKPLDAEGD